MTVENAPTRTNAWPPETFEIMRASLAAGDSAKICGAKIGKSRSAVIGMARRLKIELGGSPSRAKAIAMSKARKDAWITRKAEALKVKKSYEAERITAKQTHAGSGLGGGPRYTPKPDTVVSLNRVSITDLMSHHCRQVGDEGMFCGNKKDDGSSYCFGHRALFCQPISENPQKRADRHTARLANHYS